MNASHIWNGALCERRWRIKNADALEGHSDQSALILRVQFRKVRHVNREEISASSWVLLRTVWISVTSQFFFVFVFFSSVVSLTLMLIGTCTILLWPPENSAQAHVNVFQLMIMAKLPQRSSWQFQKDCQQTSTLTKRKKKKKLAAAGHTFALFCPATCFNLWQACHSSPDLPYMTHFPHSICCQARCADLWAIKTAPAK